MPVAIYPGSFDPLTNGHLSLIQRGLQMFDRLIVAIAVNPKKMPLFTRGGAQDTDPRGLPGPPGGGGRLPGPARGVRAQRKVNVILRGLRAVSDFEYEFQLANMNRKLAPGIETVFMMTGEDYFYISSQLVREVASLRRRRGGAGASQRARKLCERSSPKPA